MDTPQTGTMTDRSVDKEAEKSDGAVVAMPSESRKEAFSTGMGNSNYGV
jgi:hypothetical protein